MFGFSIGKILLTAAVIAAVWFVAKSIGGRNRMAAKKAAATPEPTPDDQVEDLLACPICGAYGKAGAAACDRADCPRNNADA